MGKLPIILFMVIAVLSGCTTLTPGVGTPNRVLAEKFVQLINDGDIDGSLSLVTADVVLTVNGENIAEGKAELKDQLTYNTEIHSLQTNCDMFNVAGEKVKMDCQYIDDYDMIIGMEFWANSYEYEVSDNRISSIIVHEKQEDWDIFHDLTNGSIGLGWDVGSDKNLTVTEFAKNSPAQQAGIQVGDQIVAINGLACDQMLIDNEAWAWIKGTAGSQVNLTVKRGSVAEQFDVVITRVDESTVTWPD